MPPLRPIALAVLVLVLGACQKDAASPADAAARKPADRAAATAAVNPSAEAATEAAAVVEPALDLGEFRIVSVLLGNAVDADRVVLADSAVFGRKDSIYASVLSTGAHQGLRLSAKWLAPDGSTIADTVEPVVPTTATATTFSVSNPQGWPSGEYQLEIGINGKTWHTEKFQVR